jgi:uncharacterized protein YhfF
MNQIETFWQNYIKKSGQDSMLRYQCCFPFGSNKKIANTLLESVLSGKKTATSSSLLSYKKGKERLPAVGDLSIVTDWSGVPKCVIETTSVIVVPFKDMTFELCEREGEDDSLESWRANHRRFFKEEGKEAGYPFTEEMPVVFEDFAVVFTQQT